MIFESTISYTIIDKKGNDKVVKERFLHDDEDLFANVEVKLYEAYKDMHDFEVCAIKKSKAKEIVNWRTNEEDGVWEAQVASTYIDDDGEESIITYKVFLFAKDFQDAHSKMAAYLAQDMNMTLVTLKLTKISNVF